MSSVHTKYGLAAYRSALSVFSIFVGSGKFRVPLKAAPLKLNVGGEGEVPGFINVQGRWVSDHAWPGSSRSGNSLQQPQDEGHKFLFADDMSKLPYNTGTVDEIITNNIPIDMTTTMGPAPSSSEIRRILKLNGKWIHNGNEQK